VDRALEISGQYGFEISEGWLNLVKFYLYGYQGEFAKALPHFQRVIQIAGNFNNPRINANVLQIQARMAALQGDTETAKAYFLKAIDDFRAINDLRNILHSNSDLAHLLRREGNLQEALLLYRETISGWQEEGSLPALAHQLECFAYMAIASGNYEHAARLLGRANATREELNAPSTDPLEIAELEQAMTQLAGAMREDERDRVMAEGAQMSLDDTITLALKEAT
jgi:tetratricopeptide (TPR) repeat protein